MKLTRIDFHIVQEVIEIPSYIAMNLTSASFVSKGAYLRLPSSNIFVNSLIIHSLHLMARKYRNQAITFSELCHTCAVL